MLCGIHIYYNYLFAGIVQISVSAAGLLSICWAPVAYIKSNWEEGGSKLCKYVALVALFIKYIFLVSCRIFSIALIAAYSTALVYMFIGIRWLSMLYVTFSLDFNEPTDITQQFPLFNVVRAALYVFVDIDFTRNKTCRLFYSIGIQANFIGTDITIIILTLNLLLGSDSKGDLGSVVIPYYGTIASLIFIFGVYPTFLWCIGERKTICLKM